MKSMILRRCALILHIHVFNFKIHLFVIFIDLKISMGRKLLLLLLGQLPNLILAVVVGTMKKAAAAIKRHIKNQTFIVSVCHTLISSRDCHLLKFSSLLAELGYLTPVAAQYERFFDVLKKNTKIPKREGKRVILRLFHTPYSPSGSLGPPR